MRSYVIPVKTINKFSEKDFSLYSFSARDYRQLLLKNKNTTTLRDLLERKVKSGKEIGSDAYLDKSKYRFLKTVNISSNYLLEESSIEYCKPENNIFPKKNEILIAKDGGGNGLGEVSLYPYENTEDTDSLSAGIIAIKIEEEKRNYSLAFLKSQHFKDFIDLNTAQGSTIRHSKLVALDYGIPFPTKTNHSNPEQIETLVSLIVQNIIDKEEQIKLKNNQVDELIEQELKNNQKAGTFSYKYPRISEMREETRLDTGIYEREFKEMSFLIENYIHGIFFLSEEKISPGVTPKDYYFSDYKRNKNFYEWVTPRNINQRQLAFRTYIFTKTKSKVKDNSLILNGIRYVGNGIFVEKGSSIYTNQNTLIINQFDDKLKQLFLFCFLTSKIGKKMQILRRNFGIVPILYTEHLCKIPIPNFSESKQHEITKFYYNSLCKNTDLNFDNYLEKEKIRNREIGIYQLNMEIFSLREQLEDLVHKIVMEEKIELRFEY